VLKLGRVVAMSFIGLTCVVVAPTQSLAADDCPVIEKDGYTVVAWWAANETR